jgi:hypothetical protein
MFTITTQSHRSSKSRVRRACARPARCPRPPSPCRLAMRSTPGGRSCCRQSAGAVVARLVLSSLGLCSRRSARLRARVDIWLPQRRNRDNVVRRSARAQGTARARECDVGTRYRCLLPALPARASSCHSRRSYQRCHTHVHFAPAQRSTRSYSAARSIASTQIWTPRVGASARA